MTDTQIIEHFGATKGHQGTNAYKVDSCYRTYTCAADRFSATYTKGAEWVDGRGERGRRSPHFRGGQN